MRIALLIVVVAAAACIRQPVPSAPSTVDPVPAATSSPATSPPTTGPAVPVTQPILVAADQRYLGTFEYDLWIPSDPGLAGAVPLVVLLHGGGPAGRMALEPLARELARHDLAVMNAGYSPPGRGGQFPGPFLAASCATAIAQEEAPGLGADPGKVFVVGYSYGAVAAAVSLHAGDLFASPDCPSESDIPAAGWVGIAGPYDIDLLAEAAADAMVSFFGGSREARAASWAAGDPYSYPAGSTIPGLLIHGTADPEVPVDVSAAYRAWLTEGGEDLELALVTDATHLSVVDPTSDTSVVGLIVSFVQRPNE